MANWYGTARTNYVLMRDEAALASAKALIAPTGMPTVGHHDNPLLLMVQGADDSDGAFCTGYREDDDDSDDGDDGDDGDEWGDDREFDFADLARHMADGQVLVAIEAGAEKLRYISGFAKAWNNKGEMVEVHLSDIYAKAKEAFGIDPAEATYMSYKE